MTSLSSRLPLAVALVLTLTGAPACAKSEEPPGLAVAQAAAPVAAASVGNGTAAVPAGEGEVSRKVIRNAELTVQARDVEALKARATRLMDQAGGYVAGSTESHGERSETSVQMTLRVPVAKLDTVLSELRGYGERVVRENVSSQDVTAEFYDLEARMRAQRAVEAQMMVIAKEARTVPDLLEVQRRLGDVRVEIERMEGRRNQLEHQASLSTLQLTIQQPSPPPPVRVVSDGSLASTAKMAASDAVRVLGGLVHGTIRVIGVLVPLALFFGPIVAVLLWMRRRMEARSQQARLGV